MRLLIFALAAMAAPASFASFAEPLTYSAREIRGQVVDDETSAPLDGVVIVAQWELVREVMGFYRRGGGEVLKVTEAVSDRDGRYLISGWSPVPRPLSMHLEERDPSLQFFKSGYYPRGVANELLSPAKHNTDSVRTSRWDGVAMRLRRYTGKPQEYKEFNGRGDVPRKVDGTLQQYAFRVSQLQTSLYWGGAWESYNWKSMPHMVLALKKERQRLIGAGIENRYLSVAPISSLYGGEEMVEEFLKEYEK